MKSIEFIGSRVSKNFKDKIINILSLIIVTLPYAYLIKYLMESVYLVYRPVLMISSLLFANYFYNDSKLGNMKISKIRFIIIMLYSAILFANLITWLEYLKITNFNLSSKQFLAIWLALIFQPYSSFNISKTRTPLVLYSLSHFFWILALFLDITITMPFFKKDSIIFSQTNFIILITLTFIAVTYSCLQQYFYKFIRRLLS